MFGLSLIFSLLVKSVDLILRCMDFGELDVRIMQKWNGQEDQYPFTRVIKFRFRINYIIFCSLSS